MSDHHSPKSLRTRKQLVVQDALSKGYDRLRTYLVRQLGNPADAEDILHGAILRAIERAEDLRSDDAVKGWLSRIVASALVDHRRRSISRRRNESELLLQRAAPAPMGNDVETAACECIYQILPTMKQEYAEAIRRIDLNDEDRSAVAAALGVSINSLTVRLHRARSQLKQRLLEMCQSCREQSFLHCSC